MDQCVCVAIALLLACFDFTSSIPEGGPPEGRESGTRLPPLEFLGRLRLVDGQPVLPAAAPAVTRQRLRQALAYVTARYPQARPTRGNLRQVLHFFDRHSGEDSF